MKKLAALILLASLVGATSAQTTFGGPDCGRWLKTQSASDKVWVAGYISGVNVMFTVNNPNVPDPLAKITSLDQVTAWLDNWCRKDPLNNTTYGLVVLHLELQAKR